MQILSIGKMGARQKKTPAVWFPLAFPLSPSSPNTQKEELTCNYSLHPVGLFVNRQFSLFGERRSQDDNRLHRIGPGKL